MADYTQHKVGDLLADMTGTVNKGLQQYYEDLFWWRVRLIAAGVALFSGVGLMAIGAGTVRAWFGG